MDFNSSIQFFDMIGSSRKLYVRFIEPICQKWNLNQNEIGVIMFLHNHSGKDRAADISSERGIAKSHISQAVAVLEKRELLARTYDPMDRRTAHLMLTPTGLTIARDGCQAQQAFFDTLYQGIATDELTAWGKTICKMAANIEAYSNAD